MTCWEGEKRGGVQAAALICSRPLAESPFPTLGLSRDLRAGSQGKCSPQSLPAPSQNDGNRGGPGCLWVAGALRGASQRHGIGLRSGQKVAGLTAGVGRCFYLNLSLCPVEMSKQSLCSSSERSSEAFLLLF